MAITILALVVALVAIMSGIITAILAYAYISACQVKIEMIRDIPNVVEAKEES